MYNIGGHANAANQKLFKIDGVNATSTYFFSANGLTNNITDDTEVHTIEFEFVFNGGMVENKSIYIQPNRGYSTSVTVNLFDVALYEIPETSVNKTYNSVYTSTELATPTRAGYTFQGWYADEKYTNAITTSSVFNKTTATFAEPGMASGSNVYVYAKWSKNN